MGEFVFAMAPEKGPSLNNKMQELRGMLLENDQFVQWYKPLLAHFKTHEAKKNFGWIVPFEKEETWLNFKSASDGHKRITSVIQIVEDSVLQSVILKKWLKRNRVQKISNEISTREPTGTAVERLSASGFFDQPAPPHVQSADAAIAKRERAQSEEFVEFLPRRRIEKITRAIIIQRIIDEVTRVHEACAAASNGAESDLVGSEGAWMDVLHVTDVNNKDEIEATCKQVRDEVARWIVHLNKHIETKEVVGTTAVSEKEVELANLVKEAEARVALAPVVPVVPAVPVESAVSSIPSDALVAFEGPPAAVDVVVPSLPTPSPALVALAETLPGSDSEYESEDDNGEDGENDDAYDPAWFDNDASECALKGLEDDDIAYLDSEYWDTRNFVQIYEDIIENLKTEATYACENEDGKCEQGTYNQLRDANEEMRNFIAPDDITDELRHAHMLRTAANLQGSVNTFQQYGVLGNMSDDEFVSRLLSFRTREGT